jgi:uncharacterized protein
MTQEHQYALVTGGTSGIGYELAKLLAKEGYHLIIVARGAEGLSKTASEIKSNYQVNVITMEKDLFERNASFEIYNELKIQNIQVDILVNDAGQGQYGEFIENDIYREMDIIQLNITSLVVLTKLFLKDMVARGDGKILNLSSIASKTPGPWQAVYHATKAFVQSFTEAVREEVKDTGVTITALLPGATQTDFFNKADMTEAKNVKGKELDDAAVVAKDGFDALMDGDDMEVSGLKNKLTVAMTGITPDATLAKRTQESQKPVSENEN